MGEPWRYEDRDHPYKISEYESLTNPDLKQKTLDFTQKLRDFNEDFKREDIAAQQQERAESVLSPGDNETQHKLWLQHQSADENRRNAFGQSFRTKYRPEVLALKDALVKRIPNAPTGLTPPNVWD